MTLGRGNPPQRICKANQNQNTTMRSLEDVKLLKASTKLTAINVLRVAAAVAIGETVTVAGDVYEANSGAGVTAGRTSVDVSAGGTKATGVVTAADQVSNNDTVVIGNKTYTFKTALTPAEGEVLIGASAAATLDNLKLAINRTAPETNDGVKYKVAAAHTQVTATTNTDTEQTVEARYTGTGPNSYATTTTAANLSWGAATLESGANPTAEQFVDALVAAVPATANYTAAKISANEVLFKQAAGGRNVAACSETLAGSNNGWSAAAFYGGADEMDDLQKVRATSRVPTAAEVALQTMHFVFGFAPGSAIAQVRSSAGAVRAFDGSIIISGNRVSVNGTGSTDVQASDIVSVIAFE